MAPEGHNSGFKKNNIANIRVLRSIGLGICIGVYGNILRLEVFVSPTAATRVCFR